MKYFCIAQLVFLIESVAEHLFIKEIKNIYKNLSNFLNLAPKVDVYTV